MEEFKQILDACYKSGLYRDSDSLLKAAWKYYRDMDEMGRVAV